jgi:hypothetical protein
MNLFRRLNRLHGRALGEPAIHFSRNSQRGSHPCKPLQRPLSFGFQKFECRNRHSCPFGQFLLRPAPREPMLPQTRSQLTQQGGWPKGIKGRYFVHETIITYFQAKYQLLVTT